MTGVWVEHMALAQGGPDLPGLRVRSEHREGSGSRPTSKEAICTADAASETALGGEETFSFGETGAHPRGQEVLSGVLNSWTEGQIRE